MKQIEYPIIFLIFSAADEHPTDITTSPLKQKWGTNVTNNSHNTKTNNKVQLVEIRAEQPPLVSDTSASLSVFITS